MADQWNNRQNVTKDKKEGKNKKEGIPGEGGIWVRKDGTGQLGIGQWDRGQRDSG